MSGEKKESAVRNPIGWVFHASLLLLGAVIALNMAIAFLKPIMPWLMAGAALTAVVWILIAITRWRRARW